PQHPGVVALADEVVRCEDARFADLPALLLGKTVIVRDLTSARAIARFDAGFRCITLAGELLETDGTLTVGTHHAEGGILSRKSELRELREQLVRLDQRLAELDQDLIDLRDRLTQIDDQADHVRRELEALYDQVSDMRGRIGQHRQRREGLNEEVTLNR